MSDPDPSIEELFQDFDDSQLVETISVTVSELKDRPAGRFLRKEHLYVWLIWEMSGRVSNGGFPCLFDSDELQLERRIEALRAIGARKALAHLRKAARAFPRGTPPEDVDQRRAYLKGLAPSARKAVDDGGWPLYYDHILPLLSDYVRTHKQIFLKLPNIATPSFFSQPTRTRPPEVSASEVEVARWILGLGGYVGFHELRHPNGNRKLITGVEELPKAGRLVEVTFPSDRRDTDTSLGILSRWQGRSAVGKVSLKTCRVGRDGLKALESLLGLRELDLGAAAVGDRDMPCIAALKKLRWLNLSGTNVTEDGLLSLSRLPSLTGLKLIGTNFNGSRLRSFRRLTTLEIGRGRIKDRALTFLRGMPDLARLEIHSGKLSPDSIREIALRRRLKGLLLWDSGLSEDALGPLEGHGGLKILHLQGMPLTRRGARILLGIPHLKEIHVGDGKIDSEATELLKAKLPDYRQLSARHSLDGEKKGESGLSLL